MVRNTVLGSPAAADALHAREIGIRMALGATRPAVLMMVLGRLRGWLERAWAAGAALAFGLMPAFAFAFNFAPRDVTVLATVSLTVAATAFMASWLPARRAAALNPDVALREE